MDHGQPHTVKRLSFRDPSPSVDNAASVMDIHLADGKKLSVQNGPFTVDNPALMVMAYLGVSPSTVEEAKGETLPLALTQNGNWVVPSSIMQSGKHALQAREWGPA